MTDPTQPGVSVTPEAQTQAAEARIAALEAGKTADDAERAADAARDAAMQAELDALKAGQAKPVDPPPPVPPPPLPGPPPAVSTMIVGARCKDTTFADMNAAVGPVGGMRLFYPAALSTTYDASQLPSGVVPFVSYKTPQTNIASFLKSLPASGRLTFHHEPEADYPSGAAFTGEFDREYQSAKAARSSIPFGMIAGAYQYRAGAGGASQGNGYDGSYLPSEADFYGFDTYQPKGPLTPLEKDPRFQRWYSLVKDRGKPLYVTEYGRGDTADHSLDAERAALIPVDAAYLRKIGVQAWMYWFTSGTTGVNWRFTDQGSIDAWRKVAAGQ